MAYLFVNKQELYFRTYHHFGFSNKSYQIRGDCTIWLAPCNTSCLNSYLSDYDRNNVSVQKLAMYIDWFIRNEVEWQVGEK